MLTVDKPKNQTLKVFAMNSKEYDDFLNKRAKVIRQYADRQIKSEAHLEEYFARKVKEAGGWAVKFNPLGNAGLPDRIVFYQGQTWLVELKTPRGTVQPHQKIAHKRFEGFGFNVRIIRNRQQIEDFIFDMTNLIP